MNRRNEGFIKTKYGRVWYEIVGKKKGVPLITIHGGPAYPHDYLGPLEDLSDDREVIFYDQLGCGNSQWPKGRDFWTFEYFLDELGELIEQLKIKEYILLGQSWGAAIAAAYAIKKPKGLKGLILADPFLSTFLWVEDAKRLIKKFPQKLQDAIEAGDESNDDYKKALDKFYYEYVFLMKEYPTEVWKAENKMNLDIYNYVWGPREFEPSGVLKDFDITDKIEKINVPTLIIAGRHDEATPEAAEYFQSLIPNSEVKIFEKSAHMPHWTERVEYMKTVRSFLKNIH